MLPRGAAPLIEMRQSGHAPAGTVWVNYGDFREPDWHRWSNTMHSPELVVRFDEPVDRLDFRCLVKLDVTLFLERYDDKAALLFSRLQEYATEIVMLSPAFDEDLGMWWLPKYGVIEFDKRHIVTAYEAAKAERSVAAHRNNTAAYNCAAEREMKLLKENTWLRC